MCLCSQVPGVWVTVKFNFFSIQLDHRGILALISKLLFSYVFIQPIMVEFALHCGAYPLCQVCVRKPAHQLLGKRSSQLAVLSEIWRCLFRAEILGYELGHRKAQVLQLTAPNCVTLLSLFAPGALPAPRPLCVSEEMLLSLICVPGAAAALGRSPSPAVICARRDKVPLLSLRSCPVWLWDPWWVSIFVWRVFWTIFNYGISASFSNSTVQLFPSLFARALCVPGWLLVSWQWLQLLFLPTAVVWA